MPGGADMAGSDTSNEMSDEDIDVTPTRALFVDMLTRDIHLDRAVLDLVDNCVDGAKRLRPGDESDYDGLEIKIELNAERFSIIDNCGGIGIDTAKHYAFRFGRAKGMTATPGSVGQFGVGMKRALFKFGHSFSVNSRTTTDRFELDVNVDEWEQKDGPWRFAFSSSEMNIQIPISETGTEIEVTPLRHDSSAQFSSSTFQNSLARQIEAAQQQYIARKLRIFVNGRALIASSWELIKGQGIEPSYQRDEIVTPEGSVVYRRIYAGIGNSSSQAAGWYVFCNGRMVLAADQTRTTGWEKGDDDQTVTMPKFHGQFARFRGFVFLDADDASVLPWNTTKTGIDVDTDVWRSTYSAMRGAMRPVIDFLNKLDAERDNSDDERPFSKAVSLAHSQPLHSITVAQSFSAPVPPRGPRQPPTTSIQFRRLVSEVDALKKELDCSTNAELGGYLFDTAYEEYVER